MSKSRFLTLDIAFLALWPLMSIALYFVAGLIWTVLSSSFSYSNALDQTAIATMVYIIFANLLIFLVPLFLILRYLQESKSITLAKLVTFIIFGALTVYILSFARRFDAAMSHLDCGDACGNALLPLTFDHLASAITIVSLVASYVTLIAIGSYLYFAKNRK
jgi:hypothetical protein